MKDEPAPAIPENSRLYATINATTEGLLAVYSDQESPLLNRKLIEMWRIPEEIMESSDYEQKLAFIVNQTKDPDRFINKIREIESNPTAATQEVVELIDGRVFELQTQPQFFNDKILGRVWNFYDITDRVKLEQQLRRQHQQSESVAMIAQRIRQSLQLEEILNTTTAEVRNFLQTERVVIYQFQADWSGFFVAESVADPDLSILDAKINDPCFSKGMVEPYRQGKVSFIEDIYTADIQLCHLELLASVKVIANLVVPIIDAGELWGLLIAHECHRTRKWQSLEIELLQSLASQLAIAIKQAELFTQLQTTNEELSHIALEDSLTKLANRRSFDKYLEQEWRRMLREKLCLSLIIGDTDYFKRYNDTYGHPAGDICLQKIAVALSQAAQRPADLVTRYGGEEFALILPNTDPQGAIYVAQRIQENIQQLNIPHSQSQVRNYVTLSLGISSVVPRQELSPANLIATADRALYQAKKQGRDRWIFAAIEDITN